LELVFIIIMFLHLLSSKWSICTKQRPGLSQGGHSIGFCFLFVFFWFSF
jgi:hypothetical protein